MDAANPFAQPPASPEPIIAQVSRQLRAETGADWSTAAPLVEGMADRVVRELWSSRVKTFVPILALRETRERLREAQAPTSLPGVSPTMEAPVIVPEHPFVPTGGDRVAAGIDRRPIDRRDALRVDDDILPL